MNIDIIELELNKIYINKDLMSRYTYQEKHPDAITCIGLFYDQDKECTSCKYKEDCLSFKPNVLSNIAGYLVGEDKKKDLALKGFFNLIFKVAQAQVEAEKLNEDTFDDKYSKDLFDKISASGILKDPTDDEMLDAISRVANKFKNKKFESGGDIPIENSADPEMPDFFGK